MPFFPPDNTLNRIERAFQHAGYNVSIGTDYTARPPMGEMCVDEEVIARAPDDDDEQLAEMALKWLQERGASSK